MQQGGADISTDLCQNGCVTLCDRRGGRETFAAAKLSRLGLGRPRLLGINNRFFLAIFGGGIMKLNRDSPIKN